MKAYCIARMKMKIVSVQELSLSLIGMKICCITRAVVWSTRIWPEFWQVAVNVTFFY